MRVDGSTLVDQLRNDELRSIRNDVTTGLREQILKALDERGRAQELIRRQYAGRYPFELLQNANDAMADSGGGKVLFAVTNSALVIADEGTGFGTEQVRAICGLARSSKDPRKSIGYKGLGFKSAGEITDRPQIISASVAFGFDHTRTRHAVEEITGALDPAQRLPEYAFPFPLSAAELGDDSDLVENLRAREFTTIMRLPYRADVVRETVERHVRETITPRLLLFLDATSTLELTGTGRDFQAVLVRQQSGAHAEALLQVGPHTGHWLVFQRTITDLDRELVDPLGDEWQKVEQVGVAVAVPLDDEGRPGNTTRPSPLHVYFPTDEGTGLPVTLHGDFALDLDRRRVATAPETLPYNQWLAGQLASLLAEAAESLAQRFPGDASVVAALAPAGHPDGFGEYVHHQCMQALRSARFVPVTGGHAAAPGDALLLPGSIRRPRLAHRFLALEHRPGVVVAVVQEHAPSRKLLTALGTPVLADDAALRLLREPQPADDSDFYEFLVEWADAAGRAFRRRLADIECVRTVGGGWVTPASGVYFPRRHDGVRFPGNLQVPVAAVPEVDGLESLLEDAGVRPFEWRQLIPDFVLPLLTDPGTGEEIRHAALAALRGYYNAERTGDQRIRTQIARVLMPARDASGTATAMRPVGDLYFSREWLGHDRLEQIYGAFGQADFLAVAPPENQEQRQAEMEFYQWMGVSNHPRIDECHTPYLLTSLGRHPHSRYGDLWLQWQTEIRSRGLDRCPQGHPLAQQPLLSSFSLDRFPQLAATRDPHRLRLLWLELAAHWAAVRLAFTAEVRCNHGWHSGDTIRTGPSLLQFLLTSLEWVPCIRRRHRVIVQPGRAWRVTSDMPPRVRDRVPVLDPELDIPGSAALVADTGVIDGARPSPADLAALLRELDQELSAVPADADTRELELAARWAMRMLNDVLRPEADTGGPVPLLARQDGRVIFSDKPYMAEDRLLAETWEPVIPILKADRGLRHLQTTLGLPVLDEIVTITPDPRGARTDLRPIVEAMINEAKPWLAAVAVDQVPSRETEIFRALSRLEVGVCDDLVLRYELNGLVRERADAVSFIATRIEQDGIIRRRIGTAHLQVSPGTETPDWFTFAPHLAQFLDVPTLGDAFALLLSASEAGRKQYLAARRITATAVAEAATRLARPATDDDLADDLLPTLEDINEEDEERTAAEPSPPTPGSSTESEATQQQTASLPDVKELPDLNHDAITVSDAPEPPPREAGPQPRPQPSPGLGPVGSVDYENQQRFQRHIGRRGEEAAYEAERRRVADLGLDPGLVTWRSKSQPSAPYDIESIDGDGQQIYIEVKATTSADPSDPFEISDAELVFMMAKRSNYYIYRVTSAHTERPAITRYQDPAGRLQAHTARLQLRSARLALLTHELGQT